MSVLDSKLGLIEDLKAYLKTEIRRKRKLRRQKESEVLEKNKNGAFSLTVSDSESRKPSKSF